MDIQVEKKVSPITVKHWKKKFDTAIRILLKNGIKSEDLITYIKIENEAFSKTNLNND
jgi:hypothetical protein